MRRAAPTKAPTAPAKTTSMGLGRALTAKQKRLMGAKGQLAVDETPSADPRMAARRAHAARQAAAAKNNPKPITSVSAPPPAPAPEISEEEELLMADTRPSPSGLSFGTLGENVGLARGVDCIVCA